ncbi:MAG TPA: prolipoprotein diacylglyceryl transferase family protein, partial [Prolixibacteraceae bacterium]|nr:prolipoprotein diacylglyceryl transferase family protein [Prolixibacteraceae bacterium]
VATNLPWGFIFERNNETIAKHPTMIYETLCYLITFGLMMYFYYKKKGMKDRTGFLTGVFFIGMFFSRFMIEFVKENQEAFENGMALNMGQLLSIPFIIAGIYLIYHSLTHPPVIYTNQTKK